MKAKLERKTRRGSLPWLWAAVLAMLATSAVASNIDPSNQHAWAENAGWLLFRPTHTGVTVHAAGPNGHLSGFAWHENVGWVKLGADAGGPYANTAATNWGVNMDADGNLSGYAWSETCGWIRFASTHGQVKVSMSTGRLDGYAWAERLGWIHFQNATPEYNVRVESIGSRALTVQSDHGVATPPAGVYTNDWGTSVECRAWTSRARPSTCAPEPRWPETTSRRSIPPT
jgi:hypothetical protein